MVGLNCFKCVPAGKGSKCEVCIQDPASDEESSHWETYTEVVSCDITLNVESEPYERLVAASLIRLTGLMVS
jgi:hypothetical protein